jgi:hypothetical protein
MPKAQLAMKARDTIVFSMMDGWLGCSEPFQATTHNMTAAERENRI